MRHAWIATLTLLSALLLLGSPSQAVASSVYPTCDPSNGPCIAPSWMEFAVPVGATRWVDKAVWFPRDPCGLGYQSLNNNEQSCVGLALVSEPNPFVSVSFLATGVGTNSGEEIGYYFDVGFHGIKPTTVPQTLQIGVTLNYGDDGDGGIPDGGPIETDIVTVTPEPSILLLLGGALGFVGIRRRLKKRS